MTKKQENRYGNIINDSRGSKADDRTEISGGNTDPAGNGTYTKPAGNGRKRRWVPVLFAVLAVLAAAFLLYTQNYYHAAEEARDALISDDAVRVEKTGNGWFFDPAAKLMGPAIE